MTRVHALIAAAALVGAVPLTAQGGTAPPANAAAGFVAADVDFMQGMIAHHQQALVMAAMAASHGASDKMVLMCKKITISQSDEIKMMQNWLRDRDLKVPDPKDPHFNEMPGMPGMQNLMPGMLTPEQIKQLDQARGRQFDSLFLVGMIQHHGGAILMVKELFAAPGGGQGAEIFRFATDVNADQTAEIERMQLWLNSLKGSQ